jgi:phospholipid/cholesterol/gamma-HCH transport system substrate-binding protein
MSGGAAAGASKPGGFGRVAAVGALVLAIIAIAWIIFGGGDDGYEYELVFETGGQLVPDNQVLIGGSPVGSVDSIELNDDGEAEVAITVDRQLHQGSSAVIRSTSLSGVANRYVSITPGPDNAPGLDSGSVITQVDTTTPVDLDQLFNALRAPERKGLQDFIQGSATVSAGRGEEANETYRYLSPALTATDRLIQEINRDSQVLSDFLVSGARVTGAVAERRDDLVGLVSNTNQALGAVAERNEEHDRSLVALPPALRQANTTFFNLRLALDDLDPLVETVRTDTKDLAPFLRQFNKVAGKSRPVFKNLRIAVNKKGKNNDLTDATGKLPAIQKAAARASGPSVQAMIDSEPVFSFIRPYSPDLFGALGKLGQLAGYYDANGHYLRVQPAGLGAFRYNTGTNELEPDFAINDVFDPYGVPFAAGSDLDIYNRCPGGVTQAALDGSNPFLDPLGPGLTTPVPPAGNDCNATDLPPGP